MQNEKLPWWPAAGTSQGTVVGFASVLQKYLCFHAFAFLALPAGVLTIVAQSSHVVGCRVSEVRGAQVWMEYIFGICRPDGRFGKLGSRSA